jgi:hypothetical protein
MGESPRRQTSEAQAGNVDSRALNELGAAAEAAATAGKPPQQDTARRIGGQTTSPAAPVGVRRMSSVDSVAPSSLAMTHRGPQPVERMTSADSVASVASSARTSYRGLQRASSSGDSHELSCEQELHALETQCAEELLNDTINLHHSAVAEKQQQQQQRRQRQQLEGGHEVCWTAADSGTPPESVDLFLSSRYEGALLEASKLAAKARTTERPIPRKPASATLPAEKPEEAEEPQKELQTLVSILSQGDMAGHAAAATKGGGKGLATERLPAEHASEAPSKRARQADDGWRWKQPPAASAAELNAASGGGGGGGSGGKRARFTQQWLDDLYHSAMPFEGDRPESGEISLQEMTTPSLEVLR